MKSQKQEVPYALHSASWSVGVTLDGLKVTVRGLLDEYKLQSRLETFQEHTFLIAHLFPLIAYADC